MTGHAPHSRVRIAPQRRSLRLRLLWGTLVWIAVALTVAGLALTSLFREHVSRQFQASLELDLNQLAASIEVNARSEPVLIRPLSDPKLLQPLSGLYWQVDAADRAGVLRSRSLWDAVIKLPNDGLEQGAIHVHEALGPDDKPVLVVERTVRMADHPGQSWRLIVAGNVQSMEKPVREWSRLLAIFLGVLFVTLMLAAMAQVFFGLAPLRSLQTALTAVRCGLARRLDGHFPQEVQPLIDDFNSVLDQNEQVVERARAQAGDLAHAIKTPLTVMANAAARDQDTQGAAGDLARLVSQQVASLLHHVEWRLKRARTAATMGMLQLRTPIKPVIDQLVRVMQRVHADRNLDIRVDCEPANIEFRGEEQDLQEVLGNLLDNACKWAATNVDVRVAMSQQRLSVRIDDDGPGLPAEDRVRVLQRGIRADEQTPGSGLGLAIVTNLVDLYGGHITLSESPAGGLRVTLEI